MIKKSNFFFALVVFVALLGCNDDDPVTTPPTPVVLADEVEVYEENLIDNGFVLAVENGGTSSYLVDKTGRRLFQWTFNDNLGNDFELLPDGRAIGIFKSANPPFSFGGFGGIIRIISPDGSLDWEFEYTSDTYIAHHDVELLPNGNVLILVWEKIDTATAQANGVNFNADVYPEKLIEVDPDTDTIVWEWRSWDHIIQDHDNTKANFGSVADNPQLIDINYNLEANGDFMHANGIDYDAVNDLIYMSVNFFSEVWVIDHSTTTAEAASNTGGNYNKGGDLIYRFGNPEVYDNTIGERLFFKNHFPNLLEDGEPGQGNILIYVNNGDGVQQSTVYELEMPATFSLLANTDNEPNVVWSFTDANLYNDRISGAVRLPNGNTLICEGDYGFWEITPNKEIAWKYNGEAGGYWRAYSYPQNFSGFGNLGGAPF